jgi:hypothetical protein
MSLSLCRFLYLLMEEGGSVGVLLPLSERGVGGDAHRRSVLDTCMKDILMTLSSISFTPRRSSCGWVGLV